MANGYPKNRTEMLRACYTLVYSRPCPRCHAATDHWRTGNGKEITMNRPGSDIETVVPHWKTCTGAKPKRGNEFYDGPLHHFAKANNARAVVLVTRAGEAYFSVDLQDDPADLHTILSVAADRVRNYLSQHQDGSN